MHQHGHKLSDTHILHADYNLKQATQQVLEHIELFQPGTACFVQNDMMALGALEALREQGIQVPDDVALIGSDNIPMGNWFTPHLTTVAVDYDRIINLTVEWVMAMASNKTAGYLPVYTGQQIDHPRHILSLSRRIILLFSAVEYVCKRGKAFQL